MRRRNVWWVVILLLFFAAGPAFAAIAAPADLSADYLANPLGLDNPRPRLAWKLRDPGRGAVQAAYQIQAAASESQLQAETDLLWDSARVRSSQQTHIAYGGPALCSGQRVVWRVRTWNGDGKPSPWSMPATFELGFLSPAEWHAQWITADSPQATNASAPAMVLRREFSVKGRIKRARLYATSLGVYQLEVNGANVGDQVLRPGWTSYDKRLQYQTYDVTALLQPGVNAIGATVGDGWYRGKAGYTGRNHYGTQRAALLELRVTFEDGTSTSVVSDASWKASTGPVLSADLLDGETYDARLEKRGWSLPGFDDSGWQPVSILAHDTRMIVAQVGPAVRRVMAVKPQRILTTPRGETVFDFGQNLVGWVRLSIRGERGTAVTMRHAEVLDKDGNLYRENLRGAAQTNTYILKGEGQESHEPHFTYQGFRYVAVAGYPGKLLPDALTAIVVHSDMGEVNHWQSSHTMLNQLAKNVEWSQRGNFLDLPTDCPQRDERLGWTGDIQIFAPAAAYNFHVAGFLTKWLRDLAADQKPDGSVPFVVPDLFSRGAATTEGAAGWGDAATVVPWTVYRFYGDVQLLDEQYPSMKAWVDYAARLAPDGIWNRGYQFGDWLSYQAPSTEARDYPGASTGKDLIATAYLAHSADIVAQAALVLGKRDDASRYAALATNVKQAFNREFVTRTGRVGENTQTAYALALHFNLLPQNVRGEAARRLVAEIAARQGHLTTGFLGTPALLPALSDSGHLDEAYRLLFQDTYPSWLYQIKQGATTVWERWDGLKPDGAFQNPDMNSFNHYAYGAVLEWMYAVIAGINTDLDAPGYKHSVIRPRPGGGLTWVRAGVETPYGKLASGWRIAGDRLRLEVTIPANTRSTVILPRAELAAISLDGRPLGSGARQQEQDVAIDVGAGTYSFEYRLTPVQH